MKGPGNCIPTGEVLLETDSRNLQPLFLLQISRACCSYIRFFLVFRMTEEYAILMKRFYSSKLSVLGKDNRTSLKAKEVLSISEILWAIQMQWDFHGFLWIFWKLFWGKSLGSTVFSSTSGAAPVESRPRVALLKRVKVLLICVYTQLNAVYI